MSITSDNLEEWLWLWGREWGERRSPDVVDGWDEGEGSTLYQAEHPLARAQGFAPGSRARVASAYRRDGSDRRRRMARDLEACGVRAVGVAYVDAIPCAETRPDLRTPRHVTAPQAMPEVLVLQRVIMDMIESPAASDYGHALCVRYCYRGDPVDRAIELGVRLGRGQGRREQYEKTWRGERPPVPIRAYQAVVEQARLVLRVKLGLV